MRTLCPECARKEGFDERHSDGSINEHVCERCEEKVFCSGYARPPAPPPVGERVQHPHFCPECGVQMTAEGFCASDSQQSWENCPKCGTHWVVEYHGVNGPGTPPGDSYGITFTYWK